MFIAKKQNVNDLIKSAKKTYYSMITEASDQKALFRVVDKISRKSVGSHLAAHTSFEELANHFQEFFSDKIVKLHTRLYSIRDLSESADLHEIKETAPPPFATLEPTTPDEVCKIIMDTRQHHVY